MVWQRYKDGDSVDCGSTIVFQGKCGTCSGRATSVEYVVPPEDEYAAEGKSNPDPDTDLDVILTCQEEGCEWEASVALMPLLGTNKMGIENVDSIDELEWDII